MKIIIPNYYNAFSCIASRCKHSCCKGWEIDIDEDTYDYYQCLNHPLKTEIINKIAVSDGCYQFVLDSDERCPFLNDSNLCRIILTLGEESLCQICSDHPRFRNFYNGIEEIGLGLCCEEAGRIILSNIDKVNLTVLFDDSDEEPLSDTEDHLLRIRSLLLSFAQDRSNSLVTRYNKIISRCNGLYKSITTISDFMKTLEIMDLTWLSKLNTIFHNNTCILDFICQEEEIAFEQLLVYLIYRHISDAENCENISKFIYFTCAMFKIIYMIYRIENPEQFNLDSLVEICRLYSSEIEYSDVNISRIINFI